MYLLLLKPGSSVSRLTLTIQYASSDPADVPLLKLADR